VEVTDTKEEIAVVAPEEDDDDNIEELKQQLLVLEEEAKKREGFGTPQESSTPETDARSIYIGNVDYSATEAELLDFLRPCGDVVRVHIGVNKFTGQPKGFAYAEFKDMDGMKNSFLLNEQNFKGRNVIIKLKRTNISGYSKRGRGRGRRGRGRGRGYRPYYRRGRGYYSPY
jgi:polyadenylate-binding protein 2